MRANPARFEAVASAPLRAWLAVNAARVDTVIAGALAYAKPESRMSRPKSRPKARTFTATAPDGFTFTRSSENHVYPFVVVATKTQAEADRLQRVADSALSAVTEDQRASHARLVEAYEEASQAWKKRRADVEVSGGKTYDDPECNRLLDLVIKREDKIKAHPAFRTLGGAYRMALPRQVDADNALIDIGMWYALGWTSRRDLAERLVGKERKDHPLHEIRILQTTERV